MVCNKLRQERVSIMERIGKDRLKQRRKGFLALFASALMLFNMVPMNALAAPITIASMSEYNFDTLIKKGDTVTGTTNFNVRLDGATENLPGGTSTKTYTFDNEISGTDRWLARQSSGGEYLYIQPVNRWTMTFDANGHGTAPEKQTVYKNDLNAEFVSFTSPTLSETGYTFGGWYKEKGCTTSWDNFQNVTSRDSASADYTAYAKWTPNAYTVVFNANGGTGTMSNQARTYNDDVALTENAFTRAGYTFSGWNTVADGSGTAYTNGASENLTSTAGDTVTLYAQWTVNNYTVTFDSDGGSAVAAQNVAYGAKVTKPDDPTKEGFVFEKWVKITEDATGAAARTTETEWDFANDTVTSDITLKAKWNAAAYTVTFDTDGGSTVASQSVANGGKATKPEDPTKEGFTFDKWVKKDTTGGETTETEWDFANDTVTSDITLTAKWKAVSYAVTFDTDGGSTVASQSVANGGKVTKPEDPTKEGFTFDKWVKKDTTGGETTETEWDFANDTVTSDITLTAKWKAVSYAVTFDTDGGSTVASQSVANGGKVTKPEDPTKEGFTFDKWVKKDTTAGETTETEWDFEKATVTSNITLTAKWKVVSYTVTFNTDGGSEVAKQSVNRGDKVTKPENPKKEGYTFDKWFTKSGETTSTWDFDKDTVISDITLYAKWNGDWNNSDSKQGLKEGYPDIPQSLIDKGYDTEQKIKDALYKVIVDDNPDYAEGNIKIDSKLYDVTFQVSFDGGKTYEAVTPENFPKDGLVVTVPYPDGTGKDSHVFKVAHMFAVEMNGHKPGDTETPTPTNTDEGIQFRVSGLSPVLVSWTTVNKTETQPSSEPGPQTTPQSRAPKTSDSTAALYIIMILALAGVSLTAYSAFGRKRR